MKPSKKDTNKKRDEGLSRRGTANEPGRFGDIGIEEPDI